jgi:hypothetical protein
MDECRRSNVFPNSIPKSRRARIASHPEFRRLVYGLEYIFHQVYVAGLLVRSKVHSQAGPRSLTNNACNSAFNNSNVGDNVAQLGLGADSKQSKRQHKVYPSFRPLVLKPCIAPRLPHKNSYPLDLSHSICSRSSVRTDSGTPPKW